MRPGVVRYEYPVNSYGKVEIPRNEEQIAYDQCLQDVIENPRHYLDNLERIKEFKVTWLWYGNKELSAKFTRNYASSHPKGKRLIKETSTKDKDY